MTSVSARLQALERPKRGNIDPNGIMEVSPPGDYADLDGAAGGRIPRPKDFGMEKDEEAEIGIAQTLESTGVKAKAAVIIPRIVEDKHYYDKVKPVYPEKSMPPRYWSSEKAEEKQYSEYDADSDDENFVFRAMYGPLANPGSAVLSLQVLLQQCKENRKFDRDSVPNKTLFGKCLVVFEACVELLEMRMNEKPPKPMPNEAEALELFKRQMPRYAQDESLLIPAASFSVIFQYWQHKRMTVMKLPLIRRFQLPMSHGNADALMNPRMQGGRRRIMHKNDGHTLELMVRLKHDLQVVKGLMANVKQREELKLQLMRSNFEIMYQEVAEIITPPTVFAVEKPPLKRKIAMDTPVSRPSQSDERSDETESHVERSMDNKPKPDPLRVRIKLKQPVAGLDARESGMVPDGKQGGVPLKVRKALKVPQHVVSDDESSDDALPDEPRFYASQADYCSRQFREIVSHYKAAFPGSVAMSMSPSASAAGASVGWWGPRIGRSNRIVYDFLSPPEMSFDDSCNLFSFYNAGSAGNAGSVGQQRQPSSNQASSSSATSAMQVDDESSFVKQERLDDPGAAQRTETGMKRKFGEVAN